MATKTYVVGTSNKVLRLDDHTGPWIDVSPAISNPDVTWYDVMTDPNDPDKVTIVGTFLDNGTGILVSTDAGQTWSNPGGNWAVAKTWYDVWYASDSVIWVVGDTGFVVKSIDGGVTFNTVTQIPFLSAPFTAVAPRFTTTINAIDANTAIVAGASAADYLVGGAGSPDTFVWKTIDGGFSWTLMNGGVSLPPAGGSAVGSPEGSWINPSDPTEMLISTSYGQYRSLDAGNTFTLKVDLPTRSGRHLTWYPNYAPTVFRHVGGPFVHVLESNDSGETWSTERSNESIIIRGAHFYSVNSGYYTAGHQIFSTSDGAVTGALSYTEADPDNTFYAVWTTEKVNTPCYLFESCDGEISLAWSDPVLAQYTSGVVELTFNFGNPYTVCGTVTEIIEGPVCDDAAPVFDSLVYSFGSETYQTCEDCLTPDSDTRCYNLISCNDDCPDVRYAISSELAPYVGQYVSLNGDLSCRYLVEATRQAYFNSLQTSDLSDPGSQFQLGIENWTIEINSVIVDGTEYITSPYVPYVLTNANYAVVECTDLVCNSVPVNTTENCISNVPAYYNQVFANHNVPLLAQCADPAYNCGGTVDVVKIQYNEGSTFTITATFTSNLGATYQVVYQVASGNVSQLIFYITPGSDPLVFDTCNNATACSGKELQVTSVDAFDNCDFPTAPETGEACEITPRIGEPGFSAKNCDPKKIIAVKTKFAESVYALFKRMRYGIDTCCEFDLDKADVKNMLVDFGFIYDPDLCVIETPVVDCCLQPCNAVVQVLVPNYITCAAPTNAAAVIALNPDCDPPVDGNANLTVG